jgi:hypothetical protein
MDKYDAKSNMSVLDKINGSEYFSAISSVDFYGATGRVVFDSDANLIAYVKREGGRGG